MLRLDVRPYARSFRHPLRTAHGLWHQRQGLLLRFADEQGRVSFGEVAPISWFGTETLEQARDWCDRFPRFFSLRQLADIPDTLPACQFGFNAAKTLVPEGSPEQPLSGVSEKPGFWPPADVCALLPTGEAALWGWQDLWRRGHPVFKWKIGIADLETEMPLFQKLVASLPAAAKLRLDANGGLTPEAAKVWLSACDRAPIPIEFIEQPLPPERILDWLPRVQGQFKTAIALDESVATFQQLQQVHRRVGDSVVYGVKPAIAGFPERVLNFCLRHRLAVVISSALETPVGRNAAFSLARALWDGGIANRALGFGVGHWFADDWETLTEEALWNRL